MDIQRKAFEAWLKSLNENGRTTYFLGQESTVAWEAWQAAKAVPNTQALHDRLLVESIKDHVDSHLTESESAIDYFDKGWFAAMRCVRHNIAMLEAQEQNQ